MDGSQERVRVPGKDKSPWDSFLIAWAKENFLKQPDQVVPGFYGVTFLDAPGNYRMFVGQAQAPFTHTLSAASTTLRKFGLQFRSGVDYKTRKVELTGEEYRSMTVRVQITKPDTSSLRIAPRFNRATSL